MIEFEKIILIIREQYECVTLRRWWKEGQNMYQLAGECLGVFLFMITSYYLSYQWVRWEDDKNHFYYITAIVGVFSGIITVCFRGHMIIVFLIASFSFILLAILFQCNMFVILLTTAIALLLQMMFFPIYSVIQFLTNDFYTFYTIITCLVLQGIGISLLYCYENLKMELQWMENPPDSVFYFKVLIMVISGIAIVFELTLQGITYFIHFDTSYAVKFFYLLQTILYLSILLIVCGMIRLMIDYKVEQQLNRALAKYQMDAKEYMKVIRAQRHDFNFHLHAISGLIGSHEFEECQKYITNMIDDASDVNDIMPINDVAIGSMLFDFRKKARTMGFDILYEITYDMRYILCNAFECNKILGNLIQNALDAVNNLEDKSYGVHVSILKRRGNTVMIVSNEFSGDENDIKNAFNYEFSTKIKHEGIGLGMVEKIAKRYNGQVYTKIEDDVISFVVNIPNALNFD